MRYFARPITLIIVGLVLMLLGVGLPFLMVTQVLESTFFLNFFSFTVSIGGLFMGIIGIAMYSRGKHGNFD